MFLRVFGAAAVAAGCLCLAAPSRAAFTVTFQDGATSLTIVDNDANDADKSTGTIQTFGSTVPQVGALAAGDGITVGGYRVGFRTVLNQLSAIGPPTTGLNIGSNAGNAIRNVSSTNHLIITVHADSAGLSGPGNVGDLYTITNSVSFAASRGLNSITATTRLQNGATAFADDTAFPIGAAGASTPAQSQAQYTRDGTPFFFTQITDIDLKNQAQTGLSGGGGTQLTVFSDFFAQAVPAPGGLARAAAAVPFGWAVRRFRSRATA